MNQFFRYKSLFNVLAYAFDRAAFGKGADRHGDGKPFTEQLVMEVLRADGPGFAVGQVKKKLEETKRLMAGSDVRNELLDCIVYLAAFVMYCDEIIAKEDDAPPAYEYHPLSAILEKVVKFSQMNGEPPASSSEEADDDDLCEDFPNCPCGEQMPEPIRSIVSGKAGAGGVKAALDAAIDITDLLADGKTVEDLTAEGKIEQGKAYKVNVSKLRKKRMN